MVICLELGTDLHMAQLMPMLLTVSCFSKIQIGFTFLVPAHPGRPRQRVVKWVWVLLKVDDEVTANGGSLPAEPESADAAPAPDVTEPVAEILEKPADEEPEQKAAEEEPERNTTASAETAAAADHSTDNSV